MSKVKTIGEAVSRIDGLMKVTGVAQYTTDFPVASMLHGYLIKSETAAGKILEIDTKAAEKVAGVVAVITHLNAPKLASTRGLRGGSILQDEVIDFFGENIGVVVAETFEQA
ncbi:MAG TPA: hypothetical protein PKE69_26305, partial [Pyrinomonadaceae bacterium]|nr:hypothetical protein [Pyrinomonadaceae bacterium]